MVDGGLKTTRHQRRLKKMGKRLRVLIVDDSENDVRLLLRRLTGGGFEPEFERVETAEAMAAALSGPAWDIIISDYSMPQFSGIAALELLKQSGLDLPFIIVSGAIGEDVAVEAMKSGAHDYVMKGNLNRLSSAIERELRDAVVRRERKQAEERLRYLAQYDPLTDLPNRNLLYERLEQAIVTGSEESKPVALMVMDVDHFKEINDTMGHQSGDLLLQQVGARLQNALRESHTIARLGGDEFGVLLPGANEQGATLAAHKLLKALEPPFVIGELAMDVRASIGIAAFPQHGGDMNTLMRRADIAMYIAKQSASGYSIYSPNHDSYNPERLTLMTELHRAIENNQLFLAYQPKIDLGTRRIVGVEALARWQHPKHGLIPPDKFIAMAERTGFIKSITMWGLNAALGQYSSWRKEGLEIPVAVNISARTLHDLTLPDLVAQLFKNHNAPADSLELEITESVIMANPAHALEILTRISGMGVPLFIDDFGTGYSSLSYLKKLPVDAIKIDKSFVIGMTKDQGDAAIVRSTIDLAHHLGLKVVAEGVENSDVWDQLLALGCDTAQGYYMSRPLPAQEMTRWLCDSPWAEERSTVKMSLRGDLQSSKQW
jgi:diguanylate cyclase (GGDEF)-like protein